MKLQWNQIDWKKAEEQVNRLQVRIVKATLEQKWRLVKRLQYLMTNSFYAKALAVKRVTTNKGKNTPGIDGAVWKTGDEKVRAALNLNCQTYHAKPLKRVYIEKFGKKEKKTVRNTHHARQSNAGITTACAGAGSGNNSRQNLVWIS